MSTEQAVRLADVAEGSLPLQLDDARICYWRSNKPVLDGFESTWWIYLPRAGVGRLSNHNVEEHVDGTITVAPSIGMRHTSGPSGFARHGFLERGTWREA